MSQCSGYASCSAFVTSSRSVVPLVRASCFKRWCRPAGTSQISLLVLSSGGADNRGAGATTGRTDGKPSADRAIFERQLRSVLKYLSYAPVLFISASEGRNVPRVLDTVLRVAAERRKRVSTGQINRFLDRVDFQRASVPMSKRVRIYYMTQAAVAPPTFVLFTDRDVKLHFSFERFLENQIRAAFGFEGTPIWFKVRPRNEAPGR